MNELSKIKWQCRRGTLELDILLEKYLSTSFQSADTREQQDFVSLLALEDTELLPYLMGEQLPEVESLATLVIKIRSLAPNYQGACS